MSGRSRPPKREETLLEAACIGDLDTVVALVQGGANPNTSNAMNGWTPLHWAAKRGHHQVVKYLLEYGADTSAKTLKGETPADIADKHTLNLFPQEALHSPADAAVDGQSTQSPASNEAKDSSYKFVPSYLAHPSFFYAKTATPQTLPSTDNRSNENSAEGIGNPRTPQHSSSEQARLAPTSPTSSSSSGHDPGNAILSLLAAQQQQLAALQQQLADLQQASCHRSEEQHTPLPATKPQEFEKAQRSSAEYFEVAITLTRSGDKHTFVAVAGDTLLSEIVGLCLPPDVAVGKEGRCRIYCDPTKSRQLLPTQTVRAAVEGISAYMLAATGAQAPSSVLHLFVLT